MKYPHLAARIFNTPLLIHPQKLDAIIAGLGERLAGGPLRLVDAAGQPMAQAAGPEMFSTRRGESTERGYRIVDGVAVLGIGGALVHRTRLEADSTMLLGYNDLAATLEDAMAHPDVHAVLQVYDSPGGEVQGAFEYAQRVHALRGSKPMRAIADGMAASAAYLGASAADEIAVTTTGYAGSVGVVMRHVDFSRALANDGIAVTHIFAGAHKVDGNPFEPLPAAVQAELQGDINELYDMFIQAVATQRGMAADAVRKTQAATYRGVAAIAAGLADRISTTDQMISELAALRARSYPAGPTARSTATTTGDHMSGTTTQAPAGAAPNAATATTTTATAQVAATFAQADIDQARAAGHQAGAAAERERTSAILGHAGAAANMAMAVQCVQLGLSTEQASALLGAQPAAAAPAASASQNTFFAAMGAVGNPAVSGVEAAATGATDEAALAAQVIAAHRAR
ncbi:S49 family peptidase [Acidovorax sp. JG5]|uniref:S49 family peptidase n=1 Tax=Acidovorax sp. JG5 TaxID=2822718 RepID=UPI001B33309E|nr:S49 family peptidase [Acidovorax sp. JG5]MBP3980867.1 S49 family peptidase [Acidovorax sp. JG5]